MTVKFSHVVAEDTPKGKGSAKFAELVKQKSGGNIDVQVYANSSLYKDAEEFDALQKGQVEFLAPSSAKFSTTVPEWQVLDLPFMFSSREGVKKVADGPVGQQLYGLLNKAQMQGLAFWDNGFRDWTDNKRPLKKPEDFKGLKFRVQGKVEESIVKALGGGAQVMAFSEVFGALQQGVVDGQSNTWSNIYTQKIHEVQKYASIAGPMEYLTYVVVANKDFWDKLSADDRQVFTDAMKEATDYEWGLAQSENETALQKVKDSGKLEFYTWTADDQKVIKDAMKPVYDEYEPKIGKEIVDKVRAAGA
jgi:C4-dicarboxylate-binding protein DctP